MKTPRRSTVDYVYSKLKIEVVEFLSSELRFNRDTDGEIYGFNAEEVELYDMFCNDMIRSIENTEINYEAVVKKYDTSDDLPF